MKKRIQLLLDEHDLETLDKLALAAAQNSIWRKAGYRPDAVSVLLELLRESEIDFSAVIRNECVIIPLIP